MVSSLDGELIDSSEFFAPMASDLIDGLVGQYKMERSRIDQLAAVVAGELGGVVHYFIDGNRSDRDNWHQLDKLFSPIGAIAALNASYWQRALGLTDVLDCMPQKRRDEWFDQIRNKKTPDFEEDVVRDTIGDLLSMRSKFFAERVDGIFRALSGDHVTNRPEGFGKRMIIAHVIDGYGSVEYRRVGCINDLRCVVAKFMGRDDLKYNATDDVIRAARRHNGQWMDVDGGALRIRVYSGVGTAHLEVHPDMAWRLNAILASLYPMAIPPKFREKPKRKPKEHRLIQRPLPWGVVSVLGSIKEYSYRDKEDFRGCYITVPRTRYIGAHSYTKEVTSQVEGVLESIGGVRVCPAGRLTYWQFDYDPQSVLDEIICSGCVPDQKSHQFYPTPEGLAIEAVRLASIGAEAGMHWLEPSAGIGGIADHMPSQDAYVQCYEVSELHCSVLEAKGYRRTAGANRSVSCLDFLDLSSQYRGGGYHRVVMNPPFSEGRWQAHLHAAANVVRQGGRLVAILPASAKGKDLLPGWASEWHGPYENEFAGTSVSVVILVATRP